MTDSTTSGTTPDPSRGSVRARPDLTLLQRAGWDDTWHSTWATDTDTLTETETGTGAGADGDAGARPAPGVDAGRLPPEPGRVLRADRGACEVLLRTGPALVEWGARLSRRVDQDPTCTPSAGDWVLVEPADPVLGTAASVQDVLPRRTAVVRLQVGRSSHGQVLAANADVVAVVEAMHPDPDTARIERLLALAWASGAAPVVVLTKADLAAHPQSVVEQTVRSAPGVLVLATSTVDGLGLEPLRDMLSQGRTIAFLGASGVGKSTLLNALAGRELMRTQELGAVHKGRHTTVTRELHLVAGGGALIDTPGMRSIGLSGAEDLEDVFPEVEALAARCRFRDCAHEVEPGCAVQAAVADGTLSERRMASYRKLRREQEFQAARVDQRVAAQRAARWKQIRSGMRERQRVEGRKGRP